MVLPEVRFRDDQAVFQGAVAGKVVTISGDPDIGAPPALTYFPAWMVDEAARMRTRLTNGSVAVGEQGLAALTDAGDLSLADRRPAHGRPAFHHRGGHRAE